MKKTTWKKIISFILVAALVVGTVHFGGTKVKADVAAPTARMNETTTDSNYPSATYTVTGGKEINSTFSGKETDVILAIDLSNSMREDGRLDSAKEAAKNFVAKLFDDNASEYVRIAIVTYGTTAGTACELTDDVNKLNTAINGLKVSRSNTNGGTNIDDAIEEAEAIFAANSADNQKAFVLLSDGEPTYANGTSTETVWEETDAFDTASLTYRGTEYDWYKYTYYTSEDGTWYCVVSGYISGNTWYYVESVRTNTTIIGPGNRCTNAVKKATVDEADNAKNSNITVYTVLFANTEKIAKEVMEAVASEGKFYSAANKDNAIKEVYATIGEEIKKTVYAGTDAYIVAELSQYVDINESKLIEGVVDYDDENRTVTWTIGTLDDNVSNTPSPEIGFVVKDFVTAEYLKKNITPVNGYYVLPVTANTKLHYKKNGVWQTPVDVTNLITVKYPVSSVIDYTINYIVDYEDKDDVQITSEIGTAFAGETVTATKNTVAKVTAGTEYNANYYEFKKDQAFSFEVNANTTTKNIYLAHKKATVTFFDMSTTKPGVIDNEVITEEVYYGDTVNTDNKVAANRTFCSLEDESTAADEYKWQGKWQGVPKVVENESYDILAVYDKGNGALYTVKFIDEDGSYLGGATKRPDTTIKTPADPEKEDDAQYFYEFKEWNLVEGTGAKVVTGGAIVVVKDNATYKAVYTPYTKTYTVTFIANGKTVDFQEAVEYGKFADAPSKEIIDSLTNEYVKFSKWDKDVATTAIVTDTVFTAEFVDRYYTVTYYDGNTKLDSVDVEAGGSVTPISPEKNGYVFVDYTVGGNKVTEGDLVFKNIISDINVYLNYQEIPKEKEEEKPAPVVEEEEEEEPAPVVEEEKEEEPAPVVEEEEKEEEPAPVEEKKETNGTPIIYYPEPSQNTEPETTEPEAAEPEKTEEPQEQPEEEIEEVAEVEDEPEVIVPETPQGTPDDEVVEIPAEPETPEGTPDDLVVDAPEVPEGLPQTGTAPVAVFFGIGAACIILGGTMIVKIRRREEEM